MKAAQSLSRSWRHSTRRRFATSWWSWLLLLAVLTWTPAAAAPRRGAGGQARDMNLDLRQGVARGTVSIYGQRYHELQVWLLDSGYPPMATMALGDLASLNDVLTAYLHYLYSENRPYGHATFTLAGVQYFHRRLWGQLRGAWAAVRTWKTAEPGELRAPVPLLVLWGLMAVGLASSGVALTALLALTFHCVLRPGESCRLTRADLMLPGDQGWNVSVGLVVIRSPKTARSAGRVQHVIIHDGLTILLCQWAWLSWPLHRKLVPFTLRDLEKFFKETLVRFGLRPNQFTPAGLRAGGTTHAYLCGSNVEQLMWRGRWEALTSLRHYLQEATATLAIGQLPRETVQQLLTTAEALRGVLIALTLAWSSNGEVG